jgi:GAF domain-containing protein
MAREGWGEYLDGVNQGERIGVQYDLTAVSPLTDEIPAASPDSGALQVPVTVADEPVGMIHIEAGDEQFWTEERLALVTAVARQVSQQVENLRLLAETDRYRNEAEQALRRLRREAWRDYLAEQLEVKTGFIYDQQQVKPLVEEEQTGDNGRDSQTIHRSLEVQGESFGELVVDDITDPKTEALVAAVAERLSGHLENLRLSAQTEKALAETAEQSRRLALLNDLSHDLSALNSTDEIFEALSKYIHLIVPHDLLSFALANPNGSSAKIVAIVDGRPMTIFEEQPLAGTMIEVAIKQRQIVYLADVNESDYADIKAMAERGGARSVMIAPLITARGVLGGLDLMSTKVDAFDAQDKNLLQQIASLVASTLESQQLFAEAQKQAAKERLVNLVSQKIQSTATIESALETTITELGKALQARYTKAELSFVKESVQES